MKAKNISYPHPVLGNEDDVRGEFNPSYFRHVLSRDKVVLRVGFELKNKTLEKLVAERKAVFIIELECGSTFFRSHFSTYEREAQFEIPSSRVRELVTAGFYMRAIERLPAYKVEGCHPDYEGFIFDIGPGDVLAVGGFSSFIAEKEFDPLKPSVSSFMAIKRGAEPRGLMEIDYADYQKIIIRLSHADWDNYVLLKGRMSLSPVLHAAIVLPVLADAVAIVQKDSPEFSGNHWFQRLSVILQQNSLMDAESLAAAQEILKGPIGRGLASLVESGQGDE